MDIDLETQRDLDDLMSRFETVVKRIQHRAKTRTQLILGDVSTADLQAELARRNIAASHCPKCNTAINIMGLDVGGGFHPGNACRLAIRERRP